MALIIVVHLDERDLSALSSSTSLRMLAQEAAGQAWRKPLLAPRHDKSIARLSNFGKSDQWAG